MINLTKNMKKLTLILLFSLPLLAFSQANKQTDNVSITKTVENENVSQPSLTIENKEKATLNPENNGFKKKNIDGKEVYVKEKATKGKKLTIVYDPKNLQK